MKISHIKDGLYNRFIKYYFERRGWKTNRKILVIESDDWGSIRMSSRDAYNTLISQGISVDRCNYCRYDSLASVDDLNCLFETLLSFKDKNNSSPVITANTITANPDFDRIRDSNFSSYFYKPFTETLKEYPDHNFGVWLEGIKQGVFRPQFHGREHLNIKRWMRKLRSNSREVHLAFENNVFGLSSSISTEGNSSFMAALDNENKSEVDENKLILKEGLALFKQIFGFKSKSFIAPNYIWSSELEPVLFEEGVTYFQGGIIQYEPSFDGKLRKKPHYIGEVNKQGQIYLTRNCLFEPSSLYTRNWVDTCMKEISVAFSLNKPAIVTSHRVNFIGYIDVGNRDRNLLMLSELLTQVIRKWPDIEFMSSDELGEYISATKNGYEHGQD